MQLFYHQLYHQSRKLSHRLPRRPSRHSIHRPPRRLPLLSLLFLSPLAIIGILTPSPTSALTLEDDRAFSVSVDYSMGIVLSSTNLTIPIYPTDTGQFGRTSTSVYVDTNNIAGYTLTLQSNTDKLTNTKLGTTIDPLDSPLSCTIESDDTCDTFPTNQWGYRIGATGSYLPATDIVNKPIELAHTDTVTTTTDPVATLYFGTKIDTHLPTGIYDGVELTFIATANIQKYNVTLLPTAGITSITLDNESPCTDTTKGCVYALEKDSEHTITANVASSHKFTGWVNSTSYGSFSDATTSTTTFTVGEGDATITANGEAALQGITKATCPNSATSVTDSRDGQSYEIAKLADGNCWMLENLRLVGSKVLTSNDTNLPSGVTFTLPASISYGFDSYTAAQINSSTMNNSVNSGGVTGNYTSSGTNSDKDAKFGVYYNYCAASAGGICASSSSSSNSPDRDICPKGWRLPTKAEYDTLLGKYSTVADFTSAFKLPFSGYFINSSAYIQGDNGRFWSSTYGGDSVYMYLLLVSSSIKNTQYHGRNYGTSVRCVLK